MSDPTPEMTAARNAVMREVYGALLDKGATTAVPLVIRFDQAVAVVAQVQAELAEARAKVERAREDALEEARWAAHCSVCDLAFTRDGEQLAPADYSNAMTAAIRSLAKG